MSDKHTDEPNRDDTDQPVRHKNSAKIDVQALQQQIAELTEALQRERADATNIRRQYGGQLAGLRVVVKPNVVRELLPVIDNFERALRHTPAELEGNDYIKGI